MTSKEDERAKAIGDKMLAADNASQSLGIKILDVKTGYAQLSMEITAQHVNGHKVAHGGLIFTLADSAFALACNSHNQNALAQHCTITFTAPGQLGDTLMAEAVERHSAGRSGIYDVKVTNQNSDLIAEFRGNSRTIKGQHFPD
jgi:acyl-CoA thioesterase